MFMLIKDTYLHSRSIDGSMDRVIDGNTGASVIEGDTGASVIDSDTGASVIEGDTGASVTEGDKGASVHTNVPTHLHAYLPA